MDSDEILFLTVSKKCDLIQLSVSPNIKGDRDLYSYNYQELDGNPDRPSYLRAGRRTRD